MTTTVIFSGKEGKNSSKVLAPPGGKSNNIFGFAEETPAPAQAQRRAPSQSPFAQDATPKPQDCGPAKPFKPNTSYNPVTHSYAQRDQPPPPQQQQQAPPQQQQQQAPPQQQQQVPPQQQQQQQQQRELPPQQQPLRASTLPQEPIRNNTDTKTSVKIYNPPGGKSSIQF